MNSLATDVLEFRDHEQVTRTLQLIETQPRALTLREPVAGWSLPVAELRIDEAAEALVLDASAEAWAEHFLPERGLELAAIADQETLLFDAIVPFPETEETPSGERHFSIPERLRVENKRKNLRLTFVKGMTARFEILGPAARPLLSARLVDLSAGGCQIELPIAAALTLDVDGPEIDIAIVFPNGDRFEGSATVRYVRLLGPGALARIGMAFGPSDELRQQQLWLWLQEIEMEIAVRQGQRRIGRNAGTLFKTEAATEPASTRKSSVARHRTAMRKPLLGIAYDLSRAALALRSDQPLPATALCDGASRLCDLLVDDRQVFLLALASLIEQPPLIQHSIAVAGRLADLVLAENDLGVDAHDVVLGALVHDIGLVTLAHTPAPTLADVRHCTGTCAGQHVATLVEQLSDHPALGNSTTRRIIAGFAPESRSATTPVGRASQAAQIVKSVDARVRGYYGQPPVTAFEACRQLYREHDFDEYWVRRYLQRQGPYPIGTMVRYNNGFRAQVMALDEHGQPLRVRVLRNLNAAGHQRLNTVLDGVDLHQLGGLQHPLAYDPCELYAPPAVMASI
ncbi:HD domain-containing protein [Salinisphaera sp. SPP-AMP-43]|uniref:PilZ domain-containing protein n=1 Tax=Salinisphaera sp. SPP-AMP-43 TaxID=3121288 RepID=UPI003C6E5DCB